MSVKHCLLLLPVLLSLCASTPPLPPATRDAASSRVVFPGQLVRRSSSEEGEDDAEVERIALGLLLGTRQGFDGVGDEESNEALTFPSSEELRGEDSASVERRRRIKFDRRRNGGNRRLGGKSKNATKEEEDIIKQSDVSFCDGNESQRGEDGVFCEDPVVYPKELVDALLAKMEAGGDKKLQAFFEGGGPKKEPEGGVGGGDFGEGQGGGGNRQRLPPPPPPASPPMMSQPLPDFEPRLPAPQGRPPAAVPIVAESDGGDSASVMAVDAQSSDSDVDEDSDVEEYDGSIGLRGGAAVLGRTGPGDSVYDYAEEDAAETESVYYSTSTTTEASASTTFKPHNQVSLGTFENDVSLCRAHMEKTYPRRGLTKDNYYRFIINDPEKKYLQPVRIETCHNPDSECQLVGGARFSDFGVQTACRQKYTYRTLLAIDENGQEVVDTFKFPSCCVCVQVERRPFTVSSPFSSHVAGQPTRTRYSSSSSSSSESSSGDLLESVLSGEATAESEASSGSPRPPRRSDFSAAASGSAEATVTGRTASPRDRRRRR